MKANKYLLPILVALVTIASLLALISGAIIITLNAISSDTGKAIVAGGVTVILSVISLVGGKLLEQKISGLFQMAAKSKSENPITNQELQRIFLDFTEKLLIWGSQEVISEWINFRNGTCTGTGAILQMERLIRAMRKDVGSQTAKIPVGTLFLLFVTDVGDMIEQAKTEAKATG